VTNSPEVHGGACEVHGGVRADAWRRPLLFLVTRRRVGRNDYEKFVVVNVTDRSNGRFSHQVLG
jgi:hypothetical protein